MFTTAIIWRGINERPGGGGLDINASYAASSCEYEGPVGNLSTNSRTMCLHDSSTCQDRLSAAIKMSQCQSAATSSMSSRKPCRLDSAEEGPNRLPQFDPSLQEASRWPRAVQVPVPGGSLSATKFSRSTKVGTNPGTKPNAGGCSHMASQASGPSFSQDSQGDIHPPGDPRFSKWDRQGCFCATSYTSGPRGSMTKYSSTVTNRELEMGRTRLVDHESPATPWYNVLFTNAWFQVLLISFICFCCPGMYNALSGLGGSGQVDPTVAANANVALLAANAATALFVVGPIFSIIGPRACWLVGGWTYALYSGSLLAFNYMANGPFVIVAGGILGVGASFLWVAQGAIMTTYVPESQKGRAIALFWIVFNMGGTIGSLASFGLNYNNPEGTVSNNTYIATIAVMGFGWVIGVFICPPSRVQLSQLREAEYMVRDRSPKALGKLIFSTIFRVKVLCSLPLFFCANVFYSYQQNDVNGKTFNIRSRSLNSALYWMAQMCGGLLMGFLMDLRFLNRRQRAWVGWVVLIITGVATWGGGYVFQKWQDERTAAGLIQDIDFTQSDISLGPMFLYIFYGLYDALWQGYCYWLIGSMSNSAAVTAILVGAYKSFQATGGAMAWRVNALKTPSMTQLAMNWGLCVGALIIAIPTVFSVTLTNVVPPEDDKGSMKVEEWESDMKARS